MNTGFDELAALEAWMLDTSLGFTAPITAEPLGRGKSNLTYALTDAAGRRAVLRRPPHGPLLPTAHDMLREARIVAALAESAVPVAAVLAICDRSDVIGVPFAVFELVEGTVLVDSTSAAATTMECRRNAGHGLVDALAALHATAVDAIGLGDLARPGSYVERQLRRWKKQWDATSDGTVPVMDEVYAQLSTSPPAQQRAALVHSDPKLDNCVFGPAGDLRALVDWELATVGDPLADVGLLLAFWAEPGDDAAALQDPPTSVPGFATRAQLLDRYASQTELSMAPIGQYLAFSYWKIACIVAGVLARRRSVAIPAETGELERFDQQVRRLAAMAAAALG